MLINRLSVLLAERSLSGSRFAVDTGIAQSTISKITSNKSKQVDYSTINTICNNLRITPEDFFEYSPIDFEVSCLKDEESDKIFLYFKVLKYDIKICTLEFSGDASYYVNMDKPEFLEDLTIEKIKDNYTSVEKVLVEFYLVNNDQEKCDEFYGLSAPFQNIVLNEINNVLGLYIKTNLTETFKDEFTFKKNSTVSSQLLDFDVHSDKHRIKFVLKTDVEEWHHGPLPF
ncbi:helix-turn-helix transcriptional regulator [Streptococcus sp. FSL R7-0212]|uniref:helix-turn-helix domain-containing protein n=1 Tax=Streptococcus TaxID=1301 RepID=UPI0030F8D9F9